MNNNWINVECSVCECDIEIDIEDYIPNTKSNRKEETPMNEFRPYLRDRLCNVFNDGRRALAGKFYLLEDNAPQTAKQFVERIQEGKFQLPTTDDNGITAYGTGPYGLIYRDPAQVADKDGYEAALKLLRDAKQEAIDVVNTLDETQSLQALKDFQAYVKSL